MEDCGLIGANGFGVVVKGDSMAGRGIQDRDVVWVNPDRPFQEGDVVLALVSDIEGNTGEAGMVVKSWSDKNGLVSEWSQGRVPVACTHIRVIGPAVGLTRWVAIQPPRAL